MGIVKRKNLSIMNENYPISLTTEQCEGIERFQTALNSKPSQTLIKERQGFKYLPISAVESLLDSWFFGLWKTTNFESKIVGNEVIVNIELHVYHPKAGVWLSRVGCGACMIRQKSGSKISDIDGKIKNALEMDYPHAKADAIKNAAKSLGKMFGRDLTRKKQDKAPFTPLIATNLKRLAEQNKKANDSK